jgi:phage tail sheath protein FI
MAFDYKTPGVYIEEIPKFPPSVAQVETAIPAFIGHTAKAIRKVAGDLSLVPTRITSLVEYVQFFGEAQPETDIEVTVTETQVAGVRQSFTVTAAFNGNRSTHNMYYALQMYFANGGGPCYIVSVDTYGALGTAIGIGTATTGLTGGLNAIALVDEPTIIVFPEGVNMSAPNYITLQQASLSQCGKLQDRFALLDVKDDASGDGGVAAFRTALSSSFLKYGAAYFPNLRTSLNYQYQTSTVNVVHNIVGGGAGALNGDSLDTVETTDNQVYAAALAAIGELRVVLPPSPIIAGIYARVDSARGVWKAPANESINAVIEPTIKIDNTLQDGLNVDAVAGKSINAIRTFTGKGTLVWGARTLAGNDNEWRYVSVRRFFNMVEESTKKATEQFVFEPNDANTWVKVQAMIENFLTLLWRAGALQGAKPEHAFYVAVGLGKTMTALDILEGRMIVEIGMAVVRPAEFIILRFSHKMAES